MTERLPSDAAAGLPAGALAPRAERLAAALKANLRRRKIQARERAAAADQPETDHGPSAGSAMSHDSARIADHKRSG